MIADRSAIASVRLRLRTVTSRLAAFRRRLHADRGGNVLMIMGFALIPLTFSVGMGIDYARAARLQTRLNALADAAALSTVTNPMMQSSTTTAANTGFRTWTQQATGTPGMLSSYAVTKTTTSLASSTEVNNGTLDIIVTDTTLTGKSRVTTVKWHVDSQNSFASMMGFSKVELSGSSSTAAKQAPNIDFYVLLDTSNSMAFPTTTAGINQLGSLTGGCTFACHSSNDKTAKKKDGTYGDYYSVALSYGIPLRVDQARKAVQSMMSTATSTQANNNATYRAALMTFASGDSRAPNQFKKLLFPVTTDLSSVSTAANNAQVTLYYSENNATSSYASNDTDTWSSDAFNKMNGLMPAPGNGSNVTGDTPQEIMFIITDGMRDETRPGGRPEVAFDTTLCNTIKARGIRIGIIYTQYLQSSIDTDPWSNANVVPYLNQIEPALQSCASSGLYYKVSTDDDISTALNQLFQAAVATAHITK